jgi:hypothetical protein
MGAIAYSDALNKARNAVDLWDLLERKHNGIKASTRKISRLMKSTGEKTAFELPLLSMGLKQKAAMRFYKQVKK